MYEQLVHLQQMNKIFDSIKPYNQFTNMQILRKSMLGNMDRSLHSLQSLHLNSNIRKALNIDHLESLSTLSRSFQVLQPDVMANIPHKLSGRLKSLNFDYLQSDSYKFLKSFSGALDNYKIQEKILGNWQTLYDSLSKINDIQFGQLMSGTNYTKEDVRQEAEEFISDIESINKKSVSEGLNIYERMRNYKDNFVKKFPALYLFLVILLNVSGFAGGIDFFYNIMRPAVENAIMYLEGNSDLFFIKTDRAKIYSNPSSRPVKDGISGGSVVIGYVYYSEQVKVLKDVKMWYQVSYTDSSGNVIVGWIAKRNLMPYADYQFHSDDLLNNG